MAEVKSVKLESLLCSKSRDILVRSNGEHAKVKQLSGKIVGLYFSASWCPPCRNFTPVLSKIYGELISSNCDFEIVFISSDRDEESHEEYFSKMPWLAIPFSDPATKRVESKFRVSGIPCLIFLDGAGNLLSAEGVRLVQDYGAEAYPFTPKRMKQLEERVLGTQNQTLRSLLVSDSRDYVITNDDKKIPVTEIEGKIVGLYFVLGGPGFPGFLDFTKKLVETYNELMKRGEDFEVVMINLHIKDLEAFKEAFAGMPWLSVPLEDKATCGKLKEYFDFESFTRLVIIGSDGKTLNPDVTEAVEEYGVDAFPFTPEKLAEAKMAKLESQTLESIFVTNEKDCVINNTGCKVPISDLVGKHVLIYFSAHWCPPCRSFTSNLVKAYHEIKAKETAFEVIFVSKDHDQASFDKYFSSMPWLAIPFDDERNWSLSHRRFKVDAIPTLVAIGPNGRTVTPYAMDLVDLYGSDAFPFTEDRIHKLEKKNLALNAKMGQKEGYICDGDVCRKA